jgi:hypothetical protein
MDVAMATSCSPRSQIDHSARIRAAQAWLTKPFREAAAVRRAAVLSLTLLLIACSSGCIGLTAQLLYWVKGGHKIEAEYAGLQDQRVAVVCVSNDSSYGPNSVAAMLARTVSNILRQKVEGIEVVHQDEIADWRDTNDWNQMDYREIGRGVAADKIVALDVDALSLYQGRTLYKGRADLTVTVYDLADEGQVVFRRMIPEFSFPRNGARHTTEMSEPRFRALFVQVMSQHVSKYFCRYNLEEEFASDAAALGI